MASMQKEILHLVEWLALTYEQSDDESDVVLFQQMFKKCQMFFHSKQLLAPPKGTVANTVKKVFRTDKIFKKMKGNLYVVYKHLKERVKSDTVDSFQAPDNCFVSRDDNDQLLLKMPTFYVIDGDLQSITLTFGQTITLTVRGQEFKMLTTGLRCQSELCGWTVFLETITLCKGYTKDYLGYRADKHIVEQWTDRRNNTIEERVRANKCFNIVNTTAVGSQCHACREILMRKRRYKESKKEVAQQPLSRQWKDWKDMNVCTLCGGAFSKSESGQYYRKVPLKRDNLEFQDFTLRKIINQCFNVISNPQACTACFQLLQQLQTYEEVKAQFLVRLNPRFQNNIQRVRSPSPEEDLVSPKRKKLTSVGHGEKFAHSTEENTPCCQRYTFSSEQRNTISQSSGKNLFNGKRDTISSAEVRNRRARKDAKRGVNLLTQSRFKDGFRLLFSSPGICHRTLVNELRYTLFNEVSTLVKLPKFPLAATGTSQNMEAFSWEEVIKIITERTPVLVKVLTALFCQRKKELQNSESTLEENKIQIGAVLAMVLFRRSKNFRFLQTLNSIQLRTAGCDSTEVFSRLNRMGLSLSAKAARFAVLKVQSDLVAHLVKAKTIIERQLQAAQSHSKEATPSYSVDVANELPREGFDPVIDEPDSEGSIEKLDDHPGFTMCWNITELTCPRRNQSQDRNVNQLFASAYVAENRVPTLRLVNQETRNASDIPLKLFHQTPDDIRSLKEDLKFCVAEILCKYFKFFRKHLQGACDDMNTNRHKYTNEMKKKSKLINMGTLQGNTTEAISIVKDLQKFIPVIKDKPIQTVLYGDNRSCERLEKTHNVGLDPGMSLSTTLEGFEPSPQEFQKRLLLLQITMDDFLTEKSAASRGTLSHMKNLLGHDSNKETITQYCFSQPADLLNIATDTYGILLAKKILQLQSIKDMPPNIKVRLNRQQKRRKYLNEVCERIVSAFWQESPVLDLVSADRHDDEAHHCTCGEELDEADAVKCGNSNCENPWLHLKCAGVTQRQLDKLGNDKDWFCSELCRASVYKYCCGVDHGDFSMIACENKRCEKKWFHFACVGITEDNVPGKDWFCEVCAKKRDREQNGQKQKPKQEDYLRKYCLALLWRGLNDRVRLKAVRAGNGDKMLMYWRIDMAEFFVRNRSKYFLHGHRLMAGINGWLPERERQDIIWNRTVNYIGGENNNLEMDLVNEYLNREYIADVKRRNGIPCETISGNGAAFRIMKQCLRRIFGEVSNQVDDPLLTMAEERPDVKDRVLDMVSEYEKDKLFDVTLGRTITGFNDFCYSIKPNKNKMIERLKRLSQELDAKRNIVSE